ncbi:MAG: AMP-binding protein [Actinomycetota bacterium]|nr:AMP-binding protein [Actinomycetota bacterium]
MLDTGWRQIRYGVAMATGRHISVTNVRRLVADLLATRAEFGTVGQDQIQEMLAAPLDAETRAAMDERRWRNAVRQAYACTAYYRRALDDLGLAPDQLTLARAYELAPTPKEAVRAMPEAFVSSKAAPVLQVWTTGTTGTPTTFWFSRYELELAASLTAVSFITSVGLGRDDVVQISISSRAVLGLYNTVEAARMIGATCFVSGVIDPAETLRRLSAPVHLPGKKQHVSVLSVTPSYLAALVQAAHDLGCRTDDFGVERLVCAGEILTDALRLRAEATFGAEVTDNYAMTETFPVAGMVCGQSHLHVGADQGLVEVLDPRTWAPTEPGHVGMLVVTPYPPYRETMPVLRLATGDLVRRLAQAPTCELAALPATSRVLGRVTRCAHHGGPPFYQRDVLELLEAEAEVLLPCRYATTAAADRFELHVVAGNADHGLERRLMERARGAALPLARVTLHTDLSTMPPPEFARALLHETVVVRDDSGSWTLR